MKKLELLGRKTAEVISFLISCFIISGLLLYLGISHLKTQETIYLDLKAEILERKIREHIVPIKVSNLGQKTPSKVVLRIEVGEQIYRIEIEYLAKLSSKTVYWTRIPKFSAIEPRVSIESYQF